MRSRLVAKGKFTRVQDSQVGVALLLKGALIYDKTYSSEEVKKSLGLRIKN
jgi:hypothetical protein